MWRKLQPIVSVRFLAFCVVGTSGLLVNLGVLALLTEVLGLQVNLASALAIETSINSNFLINDLWTFRDRRKGAPPFVHRWLQFHIVCLIGALLQWSVFVSSNTVCFFLTAGSEQIEAFHSAGNGFWSVYFLQPIVNPPDVGVWKYFSQILGIGAATLWNFLANFYWTWQKQKDT